MSKNLSLVFLPWSAKYLLCIGPSQSQWQTLYLSIHKLWNLNLGARDNFRHCLTHCNTFHMNYSRQNYCCLKTQKIFAEKSREMLKISFFNWAWPFYVLLFLRWDWTKNCCRQPTRSQNDLCRRMFFRTFRFFHQKSSWICIFYK